VFEAPAKAEPVVAPSPVVAAPQSIVSDAHPLPPASFTAASSHTTGGAASAPAPAREPEVPKAAPPAIESVPVPEKAIEPAVSQSSPVTGSAPTFSYGGSIDSQSNGGSKKIFIGVAAAVALVVAGYFGWNQFKPHSESSSTPQATQPASVPTQAAKSNGTSAVPAGTSAPVETAKTSAAAPSSEAIETEAAPKDSAHTATKSDKSSATTSKPTHEESVEAEPEPEPLLVKGGKAPATHAKTATADAAAPSLIGMAAPSSAPPPDLVPTTTPTFKPVLQTISVSQGVSQGLLYKKVAPSYPASALRLRIEGKVELMATISKEGNITQVKVLSGDGQLSKAAADAVKQWKYKPYLLNGEPVEIQTQVTVNFKLPN
jgi:TonB family protein